MAGRLQLLIFSVPAVLVAVVALFSSIARAQQGPVFPDVVITNDTQPTADTTLYVFADFLNLNDYLPSGADPNNALWSFSASSRYRINGALPLQLNTESPGTPPSNKVINSATTIANAGEFDIDNNPLTPTIRDATLSPFGGPNTASGVAPGEVANSEVIVLFTSDGTTLTAQHEFIAYTIESGGLNAEHDRLSAPVTGGGTNIAANNFVTDPNGWVQGQQSGGATVAFASGLCVTVNPTGANIGEWISPYGIIPLHDNSVWRLRATMTTTQTVPGSVPLWDLYIQNLETGTGTHGAQAYLADYFFLDNTGSANAIKGPAAGINQFEVWFTPPAVRTPQWRNTTTGAFQPALDADNDARIGFRVLDVDGSGIAADQDSGTICMTALTIDRFDLATESTVTDDYALDPPVNGKNGVSVADVVGNTTDGGGSTINLSTGPMIITPRDNNGWLNEITTITPGDINCPKLDSFNYGNGIETVDNYPVDWFSNELYELVVEASAADAAGDTNGPDSLRLGIDSKTLELFADSYTLSGFAGAPGMPKQVATVGATQLYSMFYWSHNRTLSAQPAAAGLRYRVEVLNTSTYNRDGVDRNKGGIVIHSIRMRRVRFDGDGQP